MSRIIMITIHIGVGSSVVCSTGLGNARASERGTGNRFPRLFYTRVNRNSGKRIPMGRKKGIIFSNRYQLVDFLGNGQGTEVWSALDVFSNVEIAIKIHLLPTATEDVLMKFAMVFKIVHTNILHPIHVAIHDGVVYEVMQYCKQGNLAFFISRNGSLSEKKCWQVLHDVSAALSCLHAQPIPILHLDIKPSNVLISENGEHLLTDYGICEYFSSSNVCKVNGTIAYMAPERFQENSFPVKACDIWSLGAMMFELMNNGELPFGEMGGSVQADAKDIPDITEIYSSELKRIVYKCLSFHPWDRPIADDIMKYSYSFL